ncbi:MAG: CoA-binding protein [Pseudomonadales bacterium]|nr:CoA-binding protein [Pseudomonadales bacterium]
MKKMKNYKNEKIAIVGVSQNQEKYGHKIFRDLIQANYNVLGINPKEKLILGQTIYPDLDSLPYIPNLVILVVPPKISLEILNECAVLGIKKVWLQPGAESSEAIIFAKNNNINLSVNLCFMAEQDLW